LLLIGSGTRFFSLRSFYLLLLVFFLFLAHTFLYFRFKKKLTFSYFCYIFYATDTQHVLKLSVAKKICHPKYEGYKALNFLRTYNAFLDTQGHAQKFVEDKTFARS
jgi:hypothetical protein